MKTLSIKNPYAVLIATGKKDVENRTWRTKFRGKILIHTPIKSVSFNEAITKEQLKTLTSVEKRELENEFGFHNSAIIGEVEIVDCVKNYDSVWSLENHYHWILDNAILYDYWIPNVKGKLSFWNYDIENPPKLINDGFHNWCNCDAPDLGHGYTGAAHCSNCGENYYR